MDREKVVKGLECCIEWDSCNKCPYETPNEYDIAECTLSLHKDALALLKEQNNIIQNILLEKENELNDKATTLQIEVQNQEIRRLLEQK